MDRVSFARRSCNTCEIKLSIGRSSYLECLVVIRCVDLIGIFWLV